MQCCDNTDGPANPTRFRRCFGILLASYQGPPRANLQPFQTPFSDPGNAKGVLIEQEQAKDIYILSTIFTEKHEVTRWAISRLEKEVYVGAVSAMETVPALAKVDPELAKVVKDHAG